MDQDDGLSTEPAQTSVAGFNSARPADEALLCATLQMGIRRPSCRSFIRCMVLKTVDSAYDVPVASIPSWTSRTVNTCFLVQSR